MNADEMKERLIKESFASKVFKYHDQVVGTPVVYEKDIDTLSIIVVQSKVKEENTVEILEEFRGNRVFPDNFMIRVEAATEEEAFKKILGIENHLCLDLLLRACNITYISHDKRCSNIIGYISDRCNDSIGKEEFERLASLVERNRFKVDSFLIGVPAIENIDFDKEHWDDHISTNDDTTLPIKSLWGYNLIETTCIFPGIIAVSSPRYIGGRTIKHFSIMKTTKDNKDTYSITVEGTMCIFNIKSVAMLVDNRYILSKINEDELRKILDKEKKELYNI